MPLRPNALTSVAAVQAAGGSGASARIEAIINAVSAQVERYVGRPLGYLEAATDQPEHYRGTGRALLLLRRWPVLEVLEVRVYGEVVEDYTLPRHLADQGMLYRAALWPAGHSFHPDLTEDPDFSMQSYPITVAYRAGYALPGQTPAPPEEVELLPADIEEAVVRTCVGTLARPVPGMAQERTPGGWSQAWRAGSEGEDGWLPADVRAVLDSYRAPASL